MLDFKQALPLFVLVHVAIFYIGGMYRQVWRYANFHSAILIAKLAFIATITSILLLYALKFPQPPRSVPIIFWLIATMGTMVNKFSWRTWINMREKIGPKGKERCLVYGAGSAGELLARHVQANPNFPYKIVGFIDDDKNKINRIIHGVRILGTGEYVADAAAETDAKSIIIALHSASGTIVRTIVENCRSAGLTPLIMPEMASSLGTEVFKPRKIDIKDLLRRSPKEIDKRKISELFVGESILVTGAGGSIGSEICRQVLTYGPRQIILLDSSEFNLYKIESELRESMISRDVVIIPCLGSAADTRTVQELFEKHRPTYILHAAAYKHVPMVEANPRAGIINNIKSTKILAEHAIRYSCRKFVLISTDKAVRPTNIMGSTKRCCELLILAYAKLFKDKTSCDFCAVRFGNVLGSSGSVIPKFLEQIERGGPITVTHADVTRYFMLTSEAVSLVLQSMAMSAGGEIFVLNMGTPIKIFDMAKQLIWLSGHTPNVDIEIKIVGLRPGEKLYEELIIEDVESQSLHEDIYTAKTDLPSPAKTLEEIESILLAAEDGRMTDGLMTLKSISAWSAPHLSSDNENASQSFH